MTKKNSELVEIDSDKESIISEIENIDSAHSLGHTNSTTTGIAKVLGFTNKQIKANKEGEGGMEGLL